MMLLLDHQELRALREVTEWIEDTVAQPHPRLGRRGVMCPVAPVSLRHFAIRYAVLRSRSVTDLLRGMAASRAAFQCLERKHAELAALVLVLPWISCDDLLAVHRQLKPQFVASGLMLGEFYPGYKSPGLHNPDFFPLSSPCPLLVIRRMVRDDDAFLTSDPRWLAYYEIYAAGGSGRADR